MAKNASILRKNQKNPCNNFPYGYEIHSIMKIPLYEWGKRHYAPAPSRYTLRAWANSGQIVPAPELVGRILMVDENAVRIQISMPGEMPSNVEGEVYKLSSRAQQILNAT